MIAALGEALSLAIKCRMRFSKDDIGPLNKLRKHTCVGVFRAFDQHYYSAACSTGGTYPALWEKANGIKPWIAPHVLAARQYQHERMEDSRVAPWMAVLIEREEDSQDLAAMGGMQVWWCTSLDNDHITLCRYQYDKSGSAIIHDRQKPAKRWKLSRQEWKDLFAKPEQTAAA
jgi:hypothetical protein